MTKTFPAISRRRGIGGMFWPLLAFVLVAAAVLTAWGISRSSTRDILDRELDMAVDRLQVHLERWFADRLRVVETLADNMTSELATDADGFREQAGRLLKLFRGMQALNWIDADWKIAVIVPVAGNRRALGADLHVHPEPSVQEALRRASRGSTVTRTSVIKLLQGMRGMATYRRVVDEQGRTLGYVNGVFAVDRIVEACLAESLPRGSCRVVVLDDNGRLVYNSHPGQKWSSWPHSRQKAVMVADRPLQVVVAPSKRRLADLSGPADILYPSIGLLLALVIAWLVRVEMVRRQRLADSEARYRALFVMAGDAIFLMRDDIFIDCNSKATELFDCRREDVIGQPPYRFSPPQQPDGSDSRRRALERIGQAHEQGLVSFEWLHCTLDGRPLECEVTLSKLLISGRDYLLASVRDVSARKAAERQRRDFEKRMLQAQKLESLGVLAGGIAHDFNNLLAVMLGNADLALTDLPAGSEARSSLQEVRLAAQRAAELTNQMLAYAGKGQLMVEAVDLNQLVNNTLRLLQASISKKAQLRLDLREGLPTVLGDRVQLRQVLMNLVINASEALGEEQGYITIRTSLDGKSKDGSDGRVMLEVTDTGCGMNEQLRQKIFDPFFSTKFAGRGLGMAAVLGIVRGHQGEITISSKPGHGTTVRVLLPASGEQARPEQEALSANTGERFDVVVLLVDDESFVRQVGRKMLERLGCRVLTADDGEQALEVFRARSGEIDLVLLDLTMPRKSGEEVFQQMQQIDGRVPVVVCSGFTEQDTASHFTELAPADFLHKPFDLGKLRMVLRRVLRPDKDGGDTAPGK